MPSPFLFARLPAIELQQETKLNPAIARKMTGGKLLRSLPLSPLKMIC